MRIIICILSLWLPVLSWAQKLSLSGMLKGLPDSTKIVLVDLQNPGTPLAETFSKSEAFTLSASLAEPSIIGLSIGDSTRTALFVGNEDVKLTGSLQQSPDEWEYTGSSIQNSRSEERREGKSVDIGDHRIISSRRRHTRFSRDWSSDVCSSDLFSKSEAFTLSASLAEPSIIGLSIGDSTRTALFVGNEDVKLTGSLQQSPDEWEYTGSSIQNS